MQRGFWDLLPPSLFLPYLPTLLTRYLVFFPSSLSPQRRTLPSSPLFSEGRESGGRRLCVLREREAPLSLRSSQTDRFGQAGRGKRNKHRAGFLLPPLGGFLDSARQKKLPSAGNAK